MVRSSRAGFELSINTLVVIILGIAIIAGGIVLISKLTGGSEKVASDLTSEQRSQLQNMMREGQLVAFYPASRTISAGKSTTFGVAIKNNLPYTATFTVDDGLAVQDEVGGDAKAFFSFVIVPPVIEAGAQKEVLMLVTPAANTPVGAYTVILTIKSLQCTGGHVTYDRIIIRQ